MSIDADFSLSIRECFTAAAEARDEDRHSALTRNHLDAVQISRILSNVEPSIDIQDKEQKERTKEGEEEKKKL